MPVAAEAPGAVWPSGEYWSRISGVKTGSTAAGAPSVVRRRVAAVGGLSAPTAAAPTTGNSPVMGVGGLVGVAARAGVRHRPSPPAAGDGGVAQVRVEALHGAGHHHLGVVVGVGDGVLEQGVHGRDELAPVAHDGDRGRRLVQHDLDAALVGRGPHPLDGVGHDQVDQHRLARRGLLGLDAREVEQVVDDAAHPEGLVVDAAGQALRHVGVGLGDERLGQEAERAHRAS